MSEKLDKDLIEKILKGLSFVTECRYCKKKIKGKTKEETDKNYKSHIDECKTLKLLIDLKKAGITYEDLKKLDKAGVFK